MMPYFWVDVGIFGKVVEKIDNDLFIYETVATKERATVTAKCARMARGAGIRNAPNLLLYHPAQFLSRVFSHKFHQVKS